MRLCRSLFCGIITLMAKHGNSQGTIPVKKSSIHRLFRTLFIVLAVLCRASVAPVANAKPIISPSLLYSYAQSDIMFAGVSSCSSIVSDGIYMGAQYNFTADQLKRLWWAATKEQEEYGEQGIKNELSIFANVYEQQGGEPGNSAGLIREVTERYDSGGAHGWFAFSTGEAYYTGANWDGGTYPEPSNTQIAIARDILNGGHRTLPPQIVEHDSLKDISAVMNHGQTFDKHDSAAYQSGETVIQNIQGSTYVFYVWSNGEKTCSSGNCGDPFGYFSDNPPVESGSMLRSTANQKYDGSSVLSNANLQQIQQNKPIYQLAASKYNLPWQLLAAIHYREHNLAVDNPANGSGAYQISGQSFLPAGAISTDEFARQSEIAASLIRSKIGSLDLTDNANVQRAFFLYNGASETYIERAINMGFTREQALNGEGSPYVMNMYDALRDPDSTMMSPLWAGRFTADGHYDQSATDSRPGAFLVYLALGGGAQSDDLCATDGGWGEQIATEAMNLTWDVSEKREKSKYAPKEEYITAMRKVGIYESYDGAPPGASCDQFVATVMRSTGADPNFNLRIANNSGTYMKNHPELYTAIAYDGTNPEILQSGDIFSTVGSGPGGHIWIYLDLGGQYGRADASWNDRTAEHYTTSTPQTSKNGMRYYVFRRNG